MGTQTRRGGRGVAFKEITGRAAPFTQKAYTALPASLQRRIASTAKQTVVTLGQEFVDEFAGNLKSNALDRMSEMVVDGAFQLPSSGSVDGQSSSP